jgi:hypothetical protein
MTVAVSFALNIRARNGVVDFDRRDITDHEHAGHPTFVRAFRERGPKASVF